MLHTVCHLGHVVCDQLQSRNDLTNSSVSRNTTEPSINDNNEAQDILKWTSLFISSKDGTYSNPLSSDIVLFHYGLLPRSTIFFFNFMITRNTYRSHNWIPRPQLIPSIATRWPADSIEIATRKTALALLHLASILGDHFITIIFSHTISNCSPIHKITR